MSVALNVDLSGATACKAGDYGFLGAGAAGALVDSAVGAISAAKITACLDIPGEGVSFVGGAVAAHAYTATHSQFITLTGTTVLLGVEG